MMADDDDDDVDVDEGLFSGFFVLRLVRRAQIVQQQNNVKQI